MTEPELRRLLAAAIPALPTPPDRLAEVGVRVHRRRARTATGAVVALAAAVVVAVALPATWASPRPDVGLPSMTGLTADPPTPIGPEGDDEPICVPEPSVTPVPSPFGAGFPPPLSGAVRVTLCGWRLRSGDGPPVYPLTARLVLLNEVDRVVAAVLGLSDEEVSPHPAESDRCGESDRGLVQMLVFDFDATTREVVRVTCDVAWQSYWRRYGARGVLATFRQAYADQPVALQGSPPTRPAG